MTALARRVRAAWREMAGTGGATTALLGLLVLGCVFLAMAGPRASLGLRTRALRQSLAGTSPLTRSVIGSLNYTALAGPMGGGRDAPALARFRAQLAGNMVREHLPLAPAATDWAGLSSGFHPAAGLGPPPAPGSRPPELELLYREGLLRRARLVAGRMPARETQTGHSSVFEVAVTQATAARFGLRPGSRLRLSPGPGLLITGIVRPARGGSPYWLADPVAARPVQVSYSGNFPPYWAAAAFIGPAELPLLPRHLDPAAMTITWGFPLDLSQLTAAGTGALEGELTGATTRAGLLRVNGYIAGTQPVSLSAGVADLLGGFSRQDRAVGQMVTLISVSLAAVGATVILLAAQLAAARRRGEFAVLAARGASRWQICLLAAVTSAAATVPAALAGAALAVALTPGPAVPLGAALAGVTAVVAAGGPPLITLRELRGAGAAQGAAGRRSLPAVRRRAAARRLAAEVTLVAAAVAGLLLLRQPGPSAGGSDAYTSLAPLLVAVPAAVAVLRGYPLVLAGLAGAVRRRRGVVAPTGFARAAQGATTVALPMFALILALTVVAFGVMVRSAIQRGEVAVSWQRVGADAVIDCSAATRPLTPAVQRAVGAVPGVTHTAAVIVISGSAHGAAVTLAAVRPADYAALISATPGGAFPAARLASPAGGKGGQAGPVPVLASSAAAAVLGRGPTSIGTGTGSLQVRVAGPAGRVPGVHSRALVILPQRALGASPATASLLLVTGTRLDGRQLTATVRRWLPGATVTLRSGVLASLTARPLPEGAYLAVEAGTGAAAGLSAAILLITLALGARSRELTLARLRILGLGAGQARWLAAVETLPLLAAVAAGGTACAWVLAPLTGPALNLSAFTGNAAGVSIHVQPGPLAASVAGLLLLAAVTIGAENITASRRAAVRVLRAEE